MGTGHMSWSSAVHPSNHSSVYRSMHASCLLHVAFKAISIMLSPRWEVNYTDKQRNCQMCCGHNACQGLVDPRMHSPCFVGITEGE